MRAITIHPVWAWAIVNGHKSVENRSWRTRHRGPLLIHAAADSPAARRGDAQARAALSALGIDAPADDAVTRGAIVGRVELLDCVELSALAGPARSPLAVGPFCWLLAQAEAFANPIPCKGKQGIWGCRD